MRRAQLRARIGRYRERRGEMLPVPPRLDEACARTMEQRAGRRFAAPPDFIGIHARKARGQPLDHRELSATAGSTSFATAGTRRAMALQYARSH